MQTTIEQDGEDLVVVIPQEIMDLAEIRIGDQVDVTLENGVIVIERHEGGNCE
ncbi:AbrB/MazE/SpoVT family DNA-binding domain-containing protein (plasmid) [Marinobacter sp. NP-4(2019)]|jgi:antitoxin component of MazEF toxin-antitoxin module|uniref:AbrB/MazE/SpoVT family DNA-binding domain-containing protein n=1 Tax=Marinobacter sp. NP-4(2019) TaxID=2488665 RepID=UPI000FC3D13C|nr:AbrB/MazE/SpoVT family DNA-binding domain-containing protein [Marinobacter sp. NP-4(2019)]AZT86100.1 AbrB/MazE/SpoVT family DNA-binding domain-containing protein [Marinobacter sp. NP-4(2019)]